MKEIKLTQGQVTLVDDEDYEELNKYPWYAKFDKKRRIFRVQRTYKENGLVIFILMHRQILGITNPKIEIDHKDRDPLNNRRDNLRVCTCSQNQQNKRKIPGCKSSYKGVAWRNDRSKWYAHIRMPIQLGQKQGKRKVLGYFIDQKDAALAYDRAAKKFFGEFASLNFPNIDQPS